MTTSLTPTYDRLIETMDRMKADRGDRPMHPVESAARRVHSKAITSGQRAGERAVANVFRPYEYEPFGSYDHREVAMRGQEAARVASARARERYVAKNWH
jgi:hypothetical protein